MNQILLAFITGLTNGGITCSITQGGLLAVAVSKSDSKYRDTTQFLIAKIVVHTLLGFILGLLGSVFSISLSLQAYLQIFIGLFMILTALRLIGVKKIFDFTEIKYSNHLSIIFNKYYKKYPHLKSYIIGASTVLVPCGATQAMLILAIGSSNPINGALIMFSFVLGTTPLFFALGISLTKIFQYRYLSITASMAVLILGIISVNNGLVLKGSTHTIQNYVYVLSGKRINNYNPLVSFNGFQEVHIDVTNSGYKYNQKSLKINVPVKLTLKTNDVVTCVNNFVIPALGISKNLPKNGTVTFEFTPTRLGILTFSCGMGMYTGSFEVVN